jgi:hypothetical protein
VYEAQHGQAKFIMEKNLETTNGLHQLLTEKIDYKDESTYKEIAENRKFRNLLRTSQRLTRSKVYEYEQNVEALTELLESIKNELGSDYEPGDSDNHQSE